MPPLQSPEQLARDLKIAFNILRDLWLQGERPLAGHRLLMGRMGINDTYSKKLYRLLHIIDLRGRYSFRVDIDPEQFDFLAAIKALVASPPSTSKIEVTPPVMHSTFPKQGDVWCYIAGLVAYRFIPNPMFGAVRLQPPLPYSGVFGVPPCREVQLVSRAVFVELAKRGTFVLLHRRYT